MEKKKAVVVDSDGLSLSITVLFLEDLGLEVYCFLNSKEALNFIKNKPQIDLLVVDIDKTKIKAYKLIEKVKEIKPDIKIILISKNDEINTNENVLRILNFKELEAAVNKIITA
ncbi:MAG TPA: response regulator [Candidatus Moranbacteria bacterium]|nr:response regulator [Candidatus Moranbacteria bacterium]